MRLESSRKLMSVSYTHLDVYKRQFLDRRVFDVSATIPTPLKANETQTKLTLREASERAIPKDWAQKEKLGFPVPDVYKRQAMDSAMSSSTPQ